MTSQINPNNIDGSYPLAGVPNNTQGMRDNFTNTKTNFQYAADEISELQSKSVLKAALTGTTLDNNMNDNLIYAVKLQDISYSYVALTTTAGTVNIDFSVAPFQQTNPSAPISLSFSNWPAAGSAGTVRVGFNITNVSQTVTLPASVSVGLTHLQGCSPGTPGVSNTITFSQTGNYAFEFVTIDGGNTIWVFDNSRPTDYFESAVNIADTTVSTSTTTGALTVGGGVGVVGNVYANRFYGDGSYLSNIYPNYVFNGTSYMGIGASNGNANISINGTSNVVVVSSSKVTVNNTGGVELIDGGTVGYGVGAGGTVSQSGNKSSGVTLNKPSGEITMQNTALGADTSVSFTLTNSTISAKDVLILNIVGGVTTPGTYNLDANCASGSATVTVRNVTAGSLSESIVLRYVVIKGSTT